MINLYGSWGQCLNIYSQPTKRLKDCYFSLPFYTPCSISPKMVCLTETSYGKGRIPALWLAPAFKVVQMPEHTKEMVHRSNCHRATLRFTCSASCNVTELQISELKSMRVTFKKLNKIMIWTRITRIVFTTETQTLCTRCCALANRKTRDSVPLLMEFTV